MTSGQRPEDVALAGHAFLTEANSLLEALNRSGVGLWRWEIGSDRLEWTHNLEAIHALAPGTFDGTLSVFLDDIHADDAGTVRDAIETAIEAEGTYEVVYRTKPRTDRQTIWIRAVGEVVRSGDRRYLTGCCQNITDQHGTEVELATRLGHLSAIAEFSTYALGETTFKNVLDRAVEISARIFDVPLAKIVRFGGSADRLDLVAGLGWKAGLVGSATVGVDQSSQAGYTLMSSGTVIVDDLRAEDRFSGPELLVSHDVISGMSVTIPGDGRPFGVLGVHDTKRRRFTDVDAASLQSLANAVANAARNDHARRAQDLLLREMAHRSNNLLQIVSVIARQTFSTGNDPRSAARAFADRLSAMSRANDLISTGGWLPTRLRSVVDSVLQPFSDQLTATGRDILLPPALCFDLAMVFHELATNSVKYGSLGQDTGAVSLDWTLEKRDAGDRLLSVHWRDPVTSASGARGFGFGRQLKSSIIEERWNGTMSIDLDDGYSFAFSIPLGEVEYFGE